MTGPGLTASYAYNPLGQMVSQTVNGATTNYQLDLGNVVAAFSGSGVYNNSGGLTAHYTYGLSLVSQAGTSGSASQYYDFGLTAILWASVGRRARTRIPTHTFHSVRSRQVTATIANPFTYVGAFGVQSDATGLLYMHERYYQPVLGQFLSKDPAAAAALRIYVGQ